MLTRKRKSDSSDARRHEISTRTSSRGDHLSSIETFGQDDHLSSSETFGQYDYLSSTETFDQDDCLSSNNFHTIDTRKDEPLSEPVNKFECSDETLLMDIQFASNYFINIDECEIKTDGESTNKGSQGDITKALRGQKLQYHSPLTAKKSKFKQTSLNNYFSFKKEDGNHKTTSTSLNTVNSSISSKSAKYSQSSSLPNDQSNGRYSSNNYSKYDCPKYKWIPNTSFTVDAFSYGAIPGCTAYFLTHFHYDHYQGLNKSFKSPIYCSQVTGNLVRHQLRVSEAHVHCLPMHSKQVVEGTEVTLLKANHCPGAVMLLFRLRNGKQILHTGDFRANSLMYSYTELKEANIDRLLLDTTYCDPQYTFPPQDVSISEIIDVVTETYASNRKTLYVCGTYTIGKERVFLAIAEVLDCKIVVTKNKLSTLNCLKDERILSRLTTDRSASCVHVLPMNMLNYNKLSAYLQDNRQWFSSIVAFQPTGWTYNGGKSTTSLQRIFSKNNVSLYGVSYSEHSSFEELRQFVTFLRPKQILPTVNYKQTLKDYGHLFSLWSGNT